MNADYTSANLARAYDRNLPLAERKLAAERFNAELEATWETEEREARNEVMAGGIPRVKADLEAPARAAYAASQHRKGDWMQTAGRRQFWPHDPRASEVCINDIAHSLAMQCRFGGHSIFHYSVAQHSVYVSQVVPPEHALAGLLHDATEAYCVDLPRPIKRFLPGYREIEDRIWLAVAEHFGLDPVLPECVHEADNAVLLAEKEQVMSHSPSLPTWSVPGEPAPIVIDEWTPFRARYEFHFRFNQLTKARNVC